MVEINKICCSEGKLVFTCSGAADVGEISDKAARIPISSLSMTAFQFIG